MFVTRYTVDSGLSITETDLKFEVYVVGSILISFSFFFGGGGMVMDATVEPRYNEGSWDWQNMFAITRFRYIEVPFHIVAVHKENRSLYQGLRYIEVGYIEVPL